MDRGANGLLVLDKPGGITSRAALDRAARWYGDACSVLSEEGLT